MMISEFQFNVLAVPGRLTVSILALLGFMHIADVAATDLMTVYDQARQDDPQFLAAAAQRMAARESRPQALARLRPDVNLTAGISRTRSELLSVLPGDKFTSAFRTINPTYFNTKTFAVSVGQPLYHHDLWVQLKQADKRIAKAEAEYAAAGQALVTRVAERYFNVLAAEDAVRFAKAEEDANQRQLDQAQQRFDVGLIAITDVHEARAGRDLARARTIVAGNQLISARESLRELTGSPATDLSGVDESMKLATPSPADVEAWTKSALTQNLQIEASQLALEIATDEVKVRRSGFYPTLDLSVSHQYQDSKDPIFGNENQNSAIGVQLTVPIYQGGATNSRVEEAIQLQEQARQGLEQQRRIVLRQTRDAYLTVQANIDQVSALNQARISAQSALDATEAGFNVGTRTTVDVLNARQNVFRAQRDLERARYDYLLNSLRLKEAAGSLSGEDVQAINHWFSVPAAER